MPEKLNLILGLVSQSAGFMELLSQVKGKLDYHDKTSKRLTEVWTE